MGGQREVWGRHSTVYYRVSYSFLQVVQFMFMLYGMFNSVWHV